MGLVVYMGEMQAGFWLENLKKSDCLGDIGLYGRMVLRSSQDAGYDHDMFLQVLQQQQKDQQLQQQLQQFQSIQQQQQQQRMATSSAGLTPATMQQQTLSSLQVSAAGQLLQQQVLTPSSASGNVVMAGSEFTYFVTLLFELQENQTDVDIQGDPREPDIFKINSTQLFFK